MARTDRSSAPWARRAQSGTLPASAHGARAYAYLRRDNVAGLPAEPTAANVASARRTFSVADLQRSDRIVNGGAAMTGKTHTVHYRDGSDPFTVPCTGPTCPLCTTARAAAIERT